MLFFRALSEANKYGRFSALNPVRARRQLAEQNGSSSRRYCTSETV